MESYLNSFCNNISFETKLLKLKTHVYLISLGEIQCIYPNKKAVESRKTPTKNVGLE